MQYKVIGRENLLYGKSQIFMANHQSDFDIEKRHELTEKVRNAIIANYDDWQEPDNFNSKYLKSEAIFLTFLTL